MVESVKVPFVIVGNRRALMDFQLAQNPDLWDFVQRFRDSFERDYLSRSWLFIEPSMVHE